MASGARVVQSRVIPPVSSTYLLLLESLLCGYAMFGRGFAYLGLTPLYIGDIIFLIGVWVVVRTFNLITLFAMPVITLLLITMCWVVLRTIPYFDRYGLDAIRDSMVIMYSGFAFIVVTLLLEDARRVSLLLYHYGSFIRIYMLVVPFLFVLEKYYSGDIPRLPLTGVPAYELRPGEIAVHVTGAVIYAMIGFRPSTRLWMCWALVPMAMVGALSRGPMLAEIIPVTFAAVWLGKGRSLILAIAVGLSIFTVAYLAEPLFNSYTEATSSVDRSISTHQLVNNAVSLVGRSGENTDSTKQWRIEWWEMIVKDTVDGPDFWTGRGFGLNLADADGFQNQENQTEAPLRSPHSVHMTMLARAGVPGFLLWELLIGTWFIMVMRTMYHAREHGEGAWAGALLFTCCYVMSILINASFDVALEGPMLGIWFWCLFGFGIGGVIIYRGDVCGPG